MIPELLPSDYVWLWRGQVALALGTVAFLLLLIPILVCQYRAYGSLNKRRLLGSGVASLYFAALVSYTVLPLPDAADVICRTPTLDPLHFMGDLAKADPGTGLLGLLQTRTALQILLNIALFVPWGIVVRGLLGRSFATATITGAMVSVLIETTQASRLLMLYPCPYRVADIDDVIMNTVGALVGALIAPLVVWWMPRPRDLSVTRLVARPVTVWRRWLSMIIECAALAVAALTPLLLVRAAASLHQVSVSDQQWRAVEYSCAGLAWLIVFGVPAVRGHGSLGMRAVWLAPVWTDGTRMLTMRRLARAGLVSGSLVLGAALSATSVHVFIGMLAFAAAVSVPFTSDKGGLSCRLMGATLVDVRAPRLPGSPPDPPVAAPALADSLSDT